MAQQATITEARGAAAIGARLIGQHHTHLLSARIAYLFTDATRTKRGRTTLATARTTNPLLRYFSATDGDPPVDFVILISEADWQSLPEPARVALIDHELSHCGADLAKDGSIRWVLWPHDLEEFRAIVERHGLWKPDVEQMAIVMGQQLPLALGAS